MSDTKITSESTSEPFETYRTSLREMKEEVAQARKTADALDAEVREVTDALETEVRESANALDKLEEAIPQWWQMFELTNREVPYQPFQMWREEAPKLLASAQEDFGSGKISRIEKGIEKTKRARSQIDKKIDSIEKEIRKERGKIKEKRKEIKNIDKKMSNAKDNYGELKSGAILLANIWGGAASLIGFLGGCIVGIGGGSPFGTGIVGAFIVGIFVWVVLYFLILLFDGSDKRKEIKDLDKNRKNVNKDLKNMKENLENLKEYKKSIDIAGGGMYSKQGQLEVLSSNLAGTGSH